MEKFNQAKYNQEYNKKHYSTFKVDLAKEEKEKLDELLKKEKITKAEFLRQSIYEFKKGRNIMMNKFDVINFLKMNAVEEQENFKEDFATGHYSTQDTKLEKYYELDDCSFNTIVLDDHSYAYIDVFDKEDESVADAYIAFDKYEELIEAIEKGEK